MGSLVIVEELCNLEQEWDEPKVTLFNDLQLLFSVSTFGHSLPLAAKLFWSSITTLSCDSGSESFEGCVSK